MREYGQVASLRQNDLSGHNILYTNTLLKERLLIVEIVKNGGVMLNRYL